MNACGHTQDREVSDLYFDTHLITQLGNVTAVWGIDDLFGKGEQEARIFDYVVDPAHGNNAPASSDASTLEENELEDERNFFGAYGQLDWNASDTVSVVAGLRLNVTHEAREGEEDLASGPVPSRQTRSDKEISGSFGVAWQAWSRGDDAITLFADYRDTFKPAAIDFGPEAEADILDPETAHASEVGIKSLWPGGRLNFELAGFDMTMKNLVVPQRDVLHQRLLHHLVDVVAPEGRGLGQGVLQELCRLAPRRGIVGRQPAHEVLGDLLDLLGLVVADEVVE
jgi:iron complex outermembrane receptor protein